MTAKDCITGRRSIRKFTNEIVSHEVLEQIVATASYAPSWKNTQITRYIALEGEQKDKIAACTMAWNQKIMEGAPMVIAVTMVTGICGFERDGSFTTKRGDGWQMFDVGAACEAFCLAAHEQGLGTVIMGIFDSDAVSAYLMLPEKQEIAALIAIGYPAESPAAPGRKPVNELLTYGFGTKES
jgi:nitroreductase